MLDCEWSKLESRFFWCIWKDHEEDADVETWILDFDAPESLPDGIYDVQSQSHRVSGVEIKDGKFVPSASTRNAIYLVGLLSDLAFVKGFSNPDNLKKRLLNSFEVTEYLWHPFLERLSWDEKIKTFETFFGS